MQPMIPVAHGVSSLMDGNTPLQPKFASVAASSSGANAIVAAVTGKRIRVVSAFLMANGSVNGKWQSASTDITGLAYLIVNVGYVLPFNPTGWFQTAAGEALNLNLSAAIAAGGCLTYVEV